MIPTVWNTVKRGLIPVARALREAVEIDPRETGLPTVKGAL